MVGTIPAMRMKANRIGPARLRKIYLAEWREHRELTQKQLGERLDPPVTDMAVSRWERGVRKPPMDALANALQIEPADLYRRPADPSADALLRGMSDDQRRQAIAILEAMKKTGTAGG